LPTEESQVGPDTRGELGSIVGVWGHPDDEAYLSAGLMVQAVRAGHRVVCVTATRGEAGFPPGDSRPISERMALREAELRSCLSLLGVGEHRWLGYGDGQCAQVPDDEAATTLAEILTEVRPDTVLTFGPDGATGHPDHIAACRWTTQAVELAGLTDARLLYATKTPQWIGERMGRIDPATVMMVEGLEFEMTEEFDLAVWFRCDDELLARKVAALRAQASQIDAIVAVFGLDEFTEFVRDEFFRDPLPTDTEFIERARSLGREPDARG
jgi:LmbE family N-acetylglucosaminyl deacetylase